MEDEDVKDLVKGLVEALVPAVAVAREVVDRDVRNLVNVRDASRRADNEQLKKQLAEVQAELADERDQRAELQARHDVSVAAEGRLTRELAQAKQTAMDLHDAVNQAGHVIAKAYAERDKFRERLAEAEVTIGMRTVEAQAANALRNAVCDALNNLPDYAYECRALCKAALDE